MNKMREYERGREDGLDLARRITREGGLEALEKECRFRGVTGIHTSLARKDLDKASEKIKQLVSECCVIMAITVLHNEFGFRSVRDCQKNMILYLRNSKERTTGKEECSRKHLNT